MNPESEGDQNIRDLLNLKLTRAEIRKLMREDNRYIKDDFFFCSEFFNQEIEMLIRIIRWVKKGYYEEFKVWAIEHNIWKQYGGCIRNGYAELYQSVFWKRHKGKYWDMKDSNMAVHPKGYYQTEIRRRLLVNKLKEMIDVIK